MLRRKSVCSIRLCSCCTGKRHLLSAKQRAVLADVRRRDAALAGRKVLVIDDDLRNIFALTSLLEHHDIEVLHAENGRAGIELLKHAPDVDIISDGHHDAQNGRV